MISTALSIAAPAAPPWNGPPAVQKKGTFWRWHWYERGEQHGNPFYERRFRVNSPETSLHPSHGKRVEARENGLMLIKAEEDLFRITGADLYVELWGGHPGTANKRVTINGRSTYWLPRDGTEEGHCTYSYPPVPLTITDLVNGRQAVQFAVDKGTTFWGHMIVDNAAVRVALADDHPDLQAMGLGAVTASVRAEPLASGEGFRLSLDGIPELLTAAASVDFQGWYYGYDENGSLQRLGWHGFTKHRQPVAYLGTAATAPFAVDWDTSMLVAQQNVAVRALVRFKSDPRLMYLTSATAGLTISPRDDRTVAILAPHDLPTQFWSRANRLKTCSIDLDVDPSRILRAELHVVTWTGGAGTVKEYFKLNGVHYPVAEGSRHELIYSRAPVEPRSLRRGRNPVELLSDSSHHGIEIIYPGPALVIEYRSQ